jgi:hypothetical protein
LRSFASKHLEIVKTLRVKSRFYQWTSPDIFTTSKNIKFKIHRTIRLSLLLYGCETWSLKLMEVRRMMVFEERVMRRIFGSKRDEVTGE